MSAPVVSEGIVQMLTRREAKRQQRRQAAPATVTAENFRLRQERRSAWNEARRAVDYWHARLKWHRALSLAQDWNVADAMSFPSAEMGPDCHILVDLWRVALVTQMLTPAPDTAAVAWKHAQFRIGQHRFSNVSPGTIERAIAADEQWLKDHPCRTTEAAHG